MAIDDHDLADALAEVDRMLHRVADRLELSEAARAFLIDDVSFGIRDDVQWSVHRCVALDEVLDGR